MGAIKPRLFDEKQIFTDEEIRSTDVQTSEIVNAGDYDVFTFYVDNQLDDDVTIQIMGNRVGSATKAVTIGATWVVSTTDQGAKTINVTNNGWLPYLFITVTAAGVPTSGNLNAYLMDR